MARDFASGYHQVEHNDVGADLRMEAVQETISKVTKDNRVLSRAVKQLLREVAAAEEELAESQVLYRISGLPKDCSIPGLSLI